MPREESDLKPELVQIEEVSSQDFTTGNCEVISMPEEVEKQLPKDIIYVSLSCKNDQYKTDLASWKGYFPITLLKEGYKSLKRGDRLNIEVTSVDSLEDTWEGYQRQKPEGWEGFEEEGIWTLFNSDQFKEGNLVGNWGSTRAKDEIENWEELEEEEESDDDSKTVYKVNLPELSKQDKFYLQWIQLED